MMLHVISLCTGHSVACYNVISSPGRGGAGGTISYYQPHNTRCHAEAVMMIMMRAVIMIGA